MKNCYSTLMFSPFGEVSRIGRVAEGRTWPRERLIWPRPFDLQTKQAFHFIPSILLRYVHLSVFSPPLSILSHPRINGVFRGIREIGLSRILSSCFPFDEAYGSAFGSSQKRASPRKEKGDFRIKDIHRLMHFSFLSFPRMTFLLELSETTIFPIGKIPEIKASLRRPNSRLGPEIGQKDIFFIKSNPISYKGFASFSRKASRM